MVFPRPIRAVVFDMDGLLFDTERLYDAAMILAAAEMGTSLTADIIRSTRGVAADAAKMIWTEQFGPDFDVDLFWSISLRRFEGLADTDLCLKEGVEALLDLIDHFRLPRAIATSTARPTVDHHLAQSGLRGRFDAIVAQGDYSDGKPHPAPYLMAAKLLGVDPANCLALEDSHNGVRSAASAGMMTVMVPDLLKPTAEMRRLCVHVVNDLNQVTAQVAASLA